VFVTGHGQRSVAAIPRPGTGERAAGAARHGWVRLAADAGRIAIVVAAAAFLVSGDGAHALKALLVLVPAVAARFVPVPPALDLVFVLALAAELIAGSLGAYDSIAWGDTLSHIVLPLLSGPILYAGLAGLGRAEVRAPATPRHLLGAGFVTAVSVLALGAAWELVEWAADSALGTEYTKGEGDTQDDLRNDAFAAVASGALVAVWLRSGDTVR
jgi:hypothetical protein